jgi:hypothetical protein
MEKVNYTDEMVRTATEMYAELGNEGMEAIAEAIGRSVRSVRAKLVREAVYVKPVKPEAAPKVEGPTKAEMLVALADLVDFDVEGLKGATKDAIQGVLDLAA